MTWSPTRPLWMRSSTQRHVARDIRWLRTTGRKDTDQRCDGGGRRRAAADAGADGVVVSNHGGRQLDGVASSISRLPAVATAWESVSRSAWTAACAAASTWSRRWHWAPRALTDRPAVIYALAACGEQGVADLLDVFQREIAIAMALLGVNRIEDITADLIER